MEQKINELESRLNNVQFGLRKIFNTTITSVILMILGSVLIGYGLGASDAPFVQFGSVIMLIGSLYQIANIIYLWKSTEGISDADLKSDKFSDILSRTKFFSK